MTIEEMNALEPGTTVLTTDGTPVEFVRMDTESVKVGQRVKKRNVAVVKDGRRERKIPPGSLHPDVRPA